VTRGRKIWRAVREVLDPTGTMYRRLAVERDLYWDALHKIRTREGKVCDHYEICEHRACQSSYAAWAIADAAVTSDTSPRKDQD
jgi:hypothetical protein